MNYSSFHRILRKYHIIWAGHPKRQKENNHFKSLVVVIKKIIVSKLHHKVEAIIVYP